MIGILDRYLLRTFCAYWVVLGAALLGLLSLFEMIGRADELAQAAEQGPILIDVLTYFALDLGFRAVQFAPYVTLLAGIGTVMQGQRAREWTPVLSSGRSTLRAFLPLFLGAALFAGLSAMAKEQFLPRALEQREALGSKLFHQRQAHVDDLWARDRQDQRLRVDRFYPRGAGVEKGGAGAESADAAVKNPADGTRPEVRGLEAFVRLPSGVERLLRAERGIWDGRAWLLERGRWIEAEGLETPVDRFEAPELGPRDLLRAHFGRISPLELPQSDLAELLARDPHHGQAATLLWAWRTAPLAHWILLMLGLPFVLRFDRRSHLEGLAVGLLLCVLYFAAEFLLHDLGGRGALTPALAGTGPKLLFGALGLWALERLPT